MTIKDMFTEEFAEKYGDVDIYGDITDTLIPAFCGPLTMTEAGKYKWRGILDVPVTVVENHYGGCDVYLNCEGYVHDHPEIFNPKFQDFCCELVEKRVKELFWEAAGYVDDSEFDRIFAQA